MGTMFTPTGAGNNGQGFGFSAPATPFVLTQLPAGIDPHDLDFHATGISGEDSPDLIVSWKVTGATDGSDIMAAHVKVALDPVTGAAIAMTQEGSTIRVNAEGSGNQDDHAIAGLLGDRFISVYHDDNPTYTDGDDIVARIIDTRAPGQDIVGDFVNPSTGVLRVTRDVLVGTNGNDIIQGDVLDDRWPDGLHLRRHGRRHHPGRPRPARRGGHPGNHRRRRRQRHLRLHRAAARLLHHHQRRRQLRGDRPAARPRTRRATCCSMTASTTSSASSSCASSIWPTAAPAAQTIAFGFPGTPPAPPAGYDGTPVAWSLTDTSQYKEILVSTDADPLTAGVGQAGTQEGIAVAGLQTDAAMAWVSEANEVWGIRYQVQGDPDPVFSTIPVQLTDGTFAGNTVSDIDLGMTGGLGFTAVWESANGGDSAIHLRIGSTNTHIVLDPNAGVPGGGLGGGEITVVGSDGAGTAVDPVIQGYEIVNTANDTLEFGFHVGYTLKATAGDAYGQLMLARYEIPVYDIARGRGGAAHPRRRTARASSPLMPLATSFPPPT